MSKHTRSLALAIGVAFLAGLTGAQADPGVEPGTNHSAPQDAPPRPAMQVADLTPRGTAPRTPMHSTATVSSKTLADINRRLNAMQQRINQLQAQVNQLRHRKPAGGGGSSGTTAAEAKTMAAEARDIALRAERKADQALATANQALSAAQSN